MQVEQAIVEVVSALAIAEAITNAIKIAKTVNVCNAQVGTSEAFNCFVLLFRVVVIGVVAIAAVAAVVFAVYFILASLRVSPVFVRFPRRIR